MSDKLASATPTTREEKIARVQLMCTEGFCNISVSDKAAIREVLHLMLAAVAANKAEFEGHKLTIADHKNATANWHLRQVERILIDAEEADAALNSEKYGTDELHECKVAIWKALNRIVDVVMNYHPKPKSKAGKKRAKKAAKKAKG